MIKKVIVAIPLLLLQSNITFAEQMPALVMTGLRVDAIKQTTEKFEFTGMAIEPKSIQVEPTNNTKK